MVKIVRACFSFCHSILPPNVQTSARQGRLFEPSPLSLHLVQITLVSLRSTIKNGLKAAILREDKVRKRTRTDDYSSDGFFNHNSAKDPPPPRPPPVSDLRNSVRFQLRFESTSTSQDFGYSRQLALWHSRYDRCIDISMAARCNSSNFPHTRTLRDSPQTLMLKVEHCLP